jgi:hypothetical protein
MFKKDITILENCKALSCLNHAKATLSIELNFSEASIVEIYKILGEIHKSIDKIS